MLIDKIKRIRPTFNITPSQGKPFYIKDAIVFYVDEPLFEFFYSRDPAKSVSVVSMPSYLPFDNIVIQFNDGACLWLCEFVEHGGDKRVLMGSFFGLDIFGWGRVYGKKELLETQLSENTPLIITTFKYSPEWEISLYRDVDIHQKDCSVMKRLFPKRAIDHVIPSIITKPAERFLTILSCKNIRTQMVVPKRRKGKKSNKQLSSYHILQISPTTRSAGGESKPLGWSNRVHLCRGHIKTYTAEKPLFGKIVGNIWCPPHARGNKKLGVIHKDYQV